MRPWLGRESWLEEQTTCRSTLGALQFFQTIQNDPDILLCREFPPGLSPDLFDYTLGILALFGTWLAPYAKSKNLLTPIP